MTGKQDTSADRTGWNWVASATPDSANRVKLPSELIDVGLFDERTTAHWGHDERTGTIVVAPDELEISNYKTLERRAIGGPKDGYRCTIPHQYTSGRSGRTHLDIQKASPSLDGDETLHFLYLDEVLERDVPWSYVMTTAELERRLKAPTDWPETVFPESEPIY